MFCHGVTRFLHHYPYLTSVNLTRTQMHLSQSRPLHGITGFVRSFHGFISVFLLHSGHTSKPPFFHCFFHCFTRALRDNGPTSEPQFYLASFYPLPILSTVFTRVLINFPSVLLNFSIVFPFFSHCFTSYSLIFSIVFLIIFPSIAISPSPARKADQGGIDTPPSPNCNLAHNPKKVTSVHLFLPPNFVIFDPFGVLCPP